MTLAEFEKKYYLHDSGIEKIFYDEANKKMTLDIEFCFWMQNWYIETEPSNGKISVMFENVSLLEYVEHDFQNVLENLNTEVVGTEINSDNILEIIVREYKNFQPLEMDFWIIKIKADNVKVTEFERYNL